MNKIIALNKSSFDREVLDALQPMLVEFRANWAENCKAMTLMLKSVAEDTAVPVKVARVNVERHEKLTEEYVVRAVPTLLIFNRGGVRDQFVGGTAEQTVWEELERFQ